MMGWIKQKTPEMRPWQHASRLGGLAASPPSSYSLGRIENGSQAGFAFAKLPLSLDAFGYHLRIDDDSTYRSILFVPGPTLPASPYDGSVRTFIIIPLATANFTDKRLAMNFPPLFRQIGEYIVMVLWISSPILALPGSRSISAGPMASSSSHAPQLGLGIARLGHNRGVGLSR